LTTKADVETSSTVPIYYGAKVTTAIAPGTYSGDVLYTVLSNPSCSTYTIVYNANGGTGEMDNQTINVGQATTLSENTFEREGYTFLGWSTESTGKTGTAVDGVGTAEDVDYENEESVTDISGFNTTKTLYAIWEVTADGDMQTWTGCSSLNSGDTVKLKDLRDGTIYNVKKLADKKCWMTDNLILGYDKGYALTSELTNIPNNDDGTLSDDGTYYLPQAGTRGNFNSATYTGSPTFDGSNDNQAQVQYRAQGSSGDQSSTGTLGQSTGYYNFYGATLGCSYYNDDISSGCASGYIQKDICPKGWRLPTGGASGEFAALDIAMGGTGTNRLDATARDRFLSQASFLYSGLYDSSQLYFVGSIGGWWSSTVSITYSSYGLDLNSSGRVNPQGNNGKHRGFAVRCIAQNNYTVSYNANGGTGAASKESDSIYETGEVTTANQGTLAKDGYNFLGWSLDQNATTATYAANSSIDVQTLISAAGSPTSGSTITLYAVWEEQTDGDMQSFNCASLASGATAKLRDTRDGQVYSVYRIPTDAKYYGTSTVANIAGKCIMTKDLNLGAVNSVSGASSSITAQGTMNLSPADSAFSIPTGSGEYITVPTTTTAVTHGTPGSGNNVYSNRQYRIDGTGDYAGRGYYTWGAAMLACPKNWRLPTSDEYSNSGSWEGQTAGLAAIVKGANASTTISNITSSPWSFVLSGNYINSFYNAGPNGYYWSTTQNGSTTSYILRMNSSNGLKRDFYEKRFGFAVRCIADPWTMQDFTSSKLSSVGDSTTLIDTRDGKEYTVKKLPDGKVWMMQNLTIGSDGAKTLTSADTNINNGTTYYLPPAGKQGSSTIDSSSTLTATDTANFNYAVDQHAKTQFRNKDDSIVNDSDTGYYNFYTATLGFSIYNDNVTSGFSYRDICPKGWRLPKTPNTTPQQISSIGSDNDFTYLARQYSTSGWQGTATLPDYYINNASSIAHTGLHTGVAANGNDYAGFSYAGYWNGTNTSASNIGSYGYYWSSSIRSIHIGYQLRFDSSYIVPQYIFDKYRGLAVRCIAKQ
ncbi:InlB B-repeat-containing protein, partial [Candidatus Saccharibacteria bacterium]|nr:InlB B-repeat-containing protein [Candidatus Saccharibacteria bacterium]